ncbi:unnamed protein product [Sphagnum jensenii]|uniref:ARM repeat superfamily protein n=1 Tax=Sphagnum jensenii TaxID=128206 RepID=A0ABP0WNU8_9BRYO
MEKRKKNSRVEDIWNALKVKELEGSQRMKAVSNNTNWNLFHIKDVVKPRSSRVAAPSELSQLDSRLPDYSLREAANIFHKSEGQLQFGSCKDHNNVMSSTIHALTRSQEENKNGSLDLTGKLLSMDHMRPPYTDIATSRYAKLKEAYLKRKLDAAATVPQSSSTSILLNQSLNSEACTCNEPDQSSGSYCSLKMSEEDDVATWIKGPESIKKDEVHSQLAAADSKMVKDSCVNGIVEQGANVNSGHKAECMIKAVQAGMKDVTVKVLASSQVTDVSLMGFKDTSTNVTDSSNGDQDARRICEENCHIMAADKGGGEDGISFSNCTESDVKSNNELDQPDSSMMQQQQQQQQQQHQQKEQQQQLKICETRENSCSQQQNLIQEEEEEEIEYELLAEALNRDLNCLVDPAASVRSAALLRLQSTLFSCVKSDDKLSCELVEEEHQDPPDQAQVQLRSKHNTLCWAAEELIVKPLLRRFADSSEKCRQLSITILHQLLQEVPSAVITLLPYVLPVITERMPLDIPLTPASDNDYLKEPVKIQAILVETSEEVRLQLVQLMHSILTKAPRLIQAFASDVASILVAATFDTHPEVLLETFSTLEQFGELMGYKLKPVGKQLVRVVQVSLSHNHYRVRVAALKAIRRLVMCGAHDAIYELTAYRDPNLIPIKCFYEPDPKTHYFAVLATDRNSSAREELYRTIACWLCELGERKEHESRLVPYLLAGFQDPSPHLRELAFKLMEEVGLQYEEENEKEVKDTRTYLTEDIDDIVSLTGAPLPHPFTRRPCLGARIMVKSVTAIILHAIAGDLECWTCGTQELAADFLVTLLMFAEDNITMHLQPLVKLLHKALSHPSIESNAKLLGLFVSPSSYLPIMLPRVSGCDVNADVSVQTVGHALHLLAGILKGSASEQILPHIPEICCTLTDCHLMTSIQQGVNEGVIAVADQLIRAWHLDKCCKEVTTMLWLLLNAAAVADFCSRSPVKAESAIQNLALSSGHSSQQSMIAAYVGEMLQILPHPKFWALRSLGALVYCRLLKSAFLLNADTLEQLIESFHSCMQECADQGVKLRLLNDVRSMIANQPIEALLEADKKKVSQLVAQFFVPCLQSGLEQQLLIIPTLDAIQDILSKPWPTSLTADNPSFHDALTRLLNSLENCLEKASQDEKTDQHSAFISNFMDADLMTRMQCNHMDDGHFHP